MILTYLKNKIKERVFKKPTQVILETTNSCNLNCPYCMVGMQNDLVSRHGNTAHDLMSRPVGFMTEETFQLVRKELIKFGIRKTYLHFQGEPFLNKLTPLFARILKEDGFEVGVFTNGQAFNDRNIDELAKTEVDLIRFSVDGASEDTYQQNRVGGRFEKVFENMKKVAIAHKGTKTRIEWQFLALRNNEHEIDKARSMAKEIGVHLFVKGFRVTDPALVPEQNQYRSTFLSKPCTDIYHQIGIYWNGDIVPCCYDVDGKEIMGNLHKTDLLTIWKNERYSLFRKSVDSFLKSPEDQPHVCKNCLRWK
jgi:radical SAM protein with 4Fe4S-binding SPASM domain